jgi:hypothetical protein
MMVTHRPKSVAVHVRNREVATLKECLMHGVLSPFGV